MLTKNYQSYLLISTIVLCLLISQGKAESFYRIDQVRQQTADGWHQIYEAYGRTIHIDISIETPEIDTLSVLRVSKRPANRYDTSNYEGEASTAICEQLCMTQNNPFEANLNAADASYQIIDGKNDTFDTIYAENNTESLAAAIKLYQSLLQGLGIAKDELDYSSPYYVSVSERYRVLGADGHYNGNAITEKGMYDIAFCQQLNDMWVFKDVNSCFRKEIAGIGSELFNNRIYFCSTDSYFLFVSLFDVINCPYVNIPLCGFEKVKESYEQYVVQKGMIREVFDLRLAYIIYHDVRYDDEFWAVPMWIMACEYYKSGNVERPQIYNEANSIKNTDAYGYILANAQTGKIIDPYDNSKARVYCPSILTWE